MSFFRGFSLNPWRILASSSPETQVEATARRAERQAVRDLTPAVLRGTQGRTLGRLLRGSMPEFLRFGRDAIGAETDTEMRVSAGIEAVDAPVDLLAEARQGATNAAVIPRRRRRGPATLPERSQRLQMIVQQVAGNGHVEYRANTIAVIRDPNIVTRVVRWVVAMMLWPPRVLAQVLAWALRPRGRGRLKRRVVIVDRRGNVVIYRA